MLPPTIVACATISLSARDMIETNMISIANDSEKLMHQTIAAKLFTQPIILHCRGQDCAYFFNQQVRSPLRPESGQHDRGQTQSRKGIKCIYLHDHAICTLADVRERCVPRSDFENLSSDNFKVSLPIICGHFFRWHSRFFTPTTAVVSFQIASGLISPVRR